MKTVSLSPHNDDVELFACYETLRHEADVIVCLRSARMGTPGYPEPLIDAATREAETQAAMNVLGMDWSQWPYLDSAPSWDALQARISALADEYDHCIAPAVERGGHAQHNQIGALAKVAFGSERLTSYLTYTREHGRSRDGVLVEATPEEEDLKRHALACYVSQATHPMTAPHFNGDLAEYVCP